MPVTPLIPAVPAFVDDVPYAPAFDDVYHSSDGGLAQARHVFIDGNRLPQRWRGLERFTILETGFGLGLNFLATWNTWRDDPDRPRQLHYVAIEKHPFSALHLEQLHARWPELACHSGQLRSAWPPLVPGFHRLLLAEGALVLTLAFGDIRDCLPQIDARIDAFYLDGFAPPKNPEMWDKRILKQIGRLAAPRSTLATYTVSAPVRHALTQFGFLCEKKPGFGCKRDMLFAEFTPHWPQPPRRTALASEKTAIVIGAGLAGAAICERLATRGWQLILIERHPQPAQGASGNLAGIFMPLLAKDNNPASRLMRAAYLFSLRAWQRVGLDGSAFPGERCGVLQLATSDEQALAYRETTAAWHFPADYARWLEASEASGLLGRQTRGGWLFPQAGWVHPATLCRAMLDACGNRLQAHYQRSATRLERTGNLWRVLDPDSRVIAEAPTVVLANGIDARIFAQSDQLPLSTIRGQVSHVPADLLPEFPVVVCSDGYITRPSGGICSVGATYDFDADPALRQDSHEENLRRLRQTFPDIGSTLQNAPLAGRVGFRCVTTDRLPLVGPLPDTAATYPSRDLRLRNVVRHPGLHGLLGYGSRGLIWAPLAAELLAALLDGEPLPIETDLAAALDPARFFLKKLRVDNK